MGFLGGFENWVEWEISDGYGGLILPVLVFICINLGFTFPLNV